ncbi:MAG: polyisoprenoid-binding protein YceI [Chlamydiales bacterium]|jgi:polyisoprenoid-binding protein YceI
MNRLTFFSLISIFTCLFSNSLFGEYWVFDKDHSSVAFKTEHLQISEVSGKFSDFYAWVEIDEKNFENSRFEITAHVDSIDTGLKARDSHLLSKVFFDSKAFPDITFIGRSMKKNGDGKYELAGDLTIKNITKDFTVELERGGFVKDHWGNQRGGFQLNGSFSRFDFGMDWGEMLMNGGLIVGETINIECNLEVIKQTDDRFLMSR